MNQITKAFAQAFSKFNIQLPEPLPEKGEIHEQGWSIRYVMLADENGQPCLEYIASHRMTNSRHARILSSGEKIDLPGIEDDYGYDPDIPGDREAAVERMRAHNAAVMADLKAKGLL